jgi:hypothetical protein
VKKGMPGIVGSIDFGGNFIPKYGWNQNEAAADPALAAAVSGLTWHALTTNRLDAEGNLKIHNYYAHPDAARSNGGDGVCKPVVVTDIVYKGEPGSLRFKMPNQVGQSRGELWANIDGTHGNSNGSNAKFVGPYTNAIAPQLWMQYAMRVDAIMLAPHRRQVDSLYSSFCSTPGVDSDHLILVKPIANAGFVGKKVYLNWQDGQTWKPGFRTVMQFISSTEVVLDASPTLPGTQGANGNAQFEGESGDNTVGTKMDIVHGNAPDGSSSSTVIEITSLNVAQAPADDYVTLYGLAGGQGFSNQAFVGPLLPDTWHQITKAIDIFPSSNDWTTPSAGSAVIASPSFTVDGGMVGAVLVISGYGGPRSYAVNASMWVPGRYTVISVDTGANTLTLNASPTPNAAGVNGEVYVSTNAYGWANQYGKNRVRLWIDGQLAIDDRTAKIGFENTPNHGIGQMTHSTAANDADPTFIHNDSWQWFSHFIFSTQPIPFATASLSGEAPPPEPENTGMMPIISYSGQSRSVRYIG